MELLKWQSNILSRALPRELAPRGVRVLGLAPGLTRTGRGSGEGNGEKSQVDFTGMPWCEPDDIAASALFLASDAAHFINTQTIFVNGGTTFPV